MRPSRLRFSAGERDVERGPLRPSSALAATTSHADADPHGPAQPGSRYDEINKSLRAEARALDSIEIANSQIIARQLGQAILDRVIARSSAEIQQVVSVGFLVAAVGFATGYVLRRGGDLDPFGFGTVYFVAGLALSLFLRISAGAAAAVAERDFAKAEGNLVSLIERTTGEMQERLSSLRAAMRADAIADLPRALHAVGEARIATIAALRFFDNSPVIGVDADGYRCHVLAGVLQDAARDRRRGAGAASAAAAAFGLGAVAGGFLLYFSLEPPLAFLPAPDILAGFSAAEAARPGIVVIAASVAAILAVSAIFGPLIPLIGAAVYPSAILAVEPARGLANRLRVRGLNAAAEPRRVIVERYADALEALERRAAVWAGGGRDSSAHGDADGAEESGPAAARFGAEPRVLAPMGPSPASAAGSSGAYSGREPGPKRAHWMLIRQSRLKR